MSECFQDEVMFCNQLGWGVALRWTCILFYGEGGVVILLVASRYRNWVKLQLCGLPVAWVQGSSNTSGCFMLQKPGQAPAVWVACGLSAGE